MNPKLACVVAVILLVLSVSAGQVVAQAPPARDPRLDKVLADWQRRQERVKTVRYRVEGQHIFPRGAFSASAGGAVKPPQDIACDVKRTLLLDFATNRHRIEEDQPQYFVATERFESYSRLFTFDGAMVMQKFLPPLADKSQPPADINVLVGNTRRLNIDSHHWPLFAGHGVVVTDGTAVIVPGKLRPQGDTSEWLVHGNGVVAQRPCLVIRSQARRMSSVDFEEFWVDVERDSALVRQVHYSNGKPAMEFNVQYQQTAAGWLAEQWRMVLSDAQAGKTIFEERMAVTELEIDPVVVDSDFRVPIEPGMLIDKRLVTAEGPAASDASQNYFRVATNGRWEEVTFATGGERKVWKYGWIGWLAGTIAAATLLLWLLRRYARMRMS